ncbi:MAG: hypothetical protein ACYDHH_11010 [Solirubrobacteraceae bacterium]
MSFDAQGFFEPLIERDPGGRSWLPELLRAAPYGDRLGETREQPGFLHPNLTVRGLEGRRPCFEYPVAPPPALLEWFIDHPERLTWREGVSLSSEVELLRRALLLDQPPGARAKAQQRARDLMPVRSAFAQEWWRFEETHEPDCLLISDELVIVIVAAGTQIEPVSPWFPERSRVHRGLEAASRVAETDQQRWGALVCSSGALAGADDVAVRASLEDGAPHLDTDGRDRLAGGYLGNVTWGEVASLQR